MKLVYNKNFFVLIVIAALVVTGTTLGIIYGLNGKGKGQQITGAVVSNGIGCADIGGEMLDDGGSAVDAAIATLLCEGVLVPQAMGLGGGFVATIYTKSTRKIETLISRESAPAAAKEDMFHGFETITGAISSAVPGELLGYWEMHKKYGRLPWEVLFKPTIKLCKEGHIVSEFLGRVIQEKEKEIREESSLSEIFVKEDGSLYVEGDYMKRPKLGQTLEIIAEKGVGEIYEGGEIGRQLVEDIQDMQGIITLEDLINYRVHWEDKYNIVANITGGYTLHTTPLPTSGVLLAFMLNVLSDFYTADQNVYWQRVVETFKHAYGLRTNLGDLENEPDMAESISKTFNNLLNPEFTKHIRSLISDNHTSDSFDFYGANFTNEEDHGTANMAVLAPNGDAVVVTSTINNYFGGKVRSKQTGIILNDEMDDFSTPGVINGYGVPASPANFIKPGKRPMSSMCPTIILDKDGNVQMLVGAAGGTKITTSVASAIIKYLILNETLEQAVDDDRLHHQLAPMQVEMEAQYPKSIQDYLVSVGHKLNILSKNTGFAALTAIGTRHGSPHPHYDRRRKGSTMTTTLKNKMNH